jgi:hypothetical protein
MEKRPNLPPIYVAALVVIAAAFAFTGQDDSPRAFGRPTPASPDSIPDLVGTWTGTWQDTIYVGAGGDLSWEISQDGPDFSASGIIDFSYFGMGSVPGTATGTITRETLEFTFEAPAAGSGAGVITDDAVSGTGMMIVPAFGPFTFEGMLTDDTIRGTFDFTNPGGGAGRAVLTKETPVERASWGEVKSRFREPGE